MTLSVSAYFVDATGQSHDLPLESEIAGVEASRRDFYGSTRSLALGLRLLPKLKDQSELMVHGSELDLLEVEIEGLNASLPAGAAGDYWRFRLNNIAMAVKTAKIYGDTAVVCIG